MSGTGRFSIQYADETVAFAIQILRQPGIWTVLCRRNLQICRNADKALESGHTGTCTDDVSQETYPEDLTMAEDSCGKNRRTFTDSDSCRACCKEKRDKISEKTECGRAHEKSEGCFSDYGIREGA